MSTTIDIDEAIAAIIKRREINAPDLSDVQFVRNGKPIHVDPKVIEQFELIGLNNTDFIRTQFMGEEGKF